LAQYIYLLMCQPYLFHNWNNKRTEKEQKGIDKVLEYLYNSLRERRG